jgi:hypothetical protein
MVDNVNDHNITAAVLRCVVLLSIVRLFADVTSEEARSVRGSPQRRGRRKEASFTRGGILLLGLSILSACTVTPTAPSVLVLPAVGKPMDVFQTDEVGCRSYAQQQIGVAPEQQAGAASGRSLQARYDMAYVQCMYSKGNAVPGVMVNPGPSVAPPPPPGTPPR